VSKTVKGGKRFGFAAIVVVGDQGGRVGFGKGKAKEIPVAIRKATEQAKRSMVRIPLKEGRTLHHDIEGRHGAGRVVMRTAATGTGIIAGGPMRAVFEMLGVQDVVAKSFGSQNPYNMIRATLDGLTKEESPRAVARRRGKKLSNILPPEARQAIGKLNEDQAGETARMQGDRRSVRPSPGKFRGASNEVAVQSAESGPSSDAVEMSNATAAEGLESRSHGESTNRRGPDFLRGAPIMANEARAIVEEIDRRDSPPPFSELLPRLLQVEVDAARKEPKLRSELLRLPDALWRALLRNLESPYHAELAAKCLIAVARPKKYWSVEQLDNVDAVEDFEAILGEIGNDAFVSMRFTPDETKRVYRVDAVVRKQAPFRINGRQPKLPESARLRKGSVLSFSSNVVIVHEVRHMEVQDSLAPDTIFDTVSGTIRVDEKSGDGDVWIHVLADSSIIATRRL